MLQFLFRPQPEISYDFVVVVYLLASISCLVLYFVEKYYGLEQIKGFWIVLSPFVPSLIWAAFMWRQAKLAHHTEPKLKSN